MTDDELISQIDEQDWTMVIRAACLHQSLLTWWLLCCKGINAELRIGGRKVDKQVLAHAWVRWGEEIISEGGVVE